MPRSTRSHLALTMPLILLTSAAARPPHKEAVAAHLGEFLPSRLNVCVLCHLPERGNADNKPHNPFGARLKAIGTELAAAGRPHDLAARCDALADEDSDGDGIPNLIELLTGHFPGDANDRPAPEEVARARQRLVALRQFQSRYPWRPYDPVSRPPLPDVKNSAWVRTPIDRFIAAEHEARKLTPRPEADRATLLRRVQLDLTGLAPTPDELQRLLNDPSPDAYEAAVDRLLSSPRYGERWGRHWMDVWRYSDWAGWTDGGQIRDSHPHIWRWRDWIIESLNADRGYDQMVREMLAADELAPDDPDTLRATGFLVRNYKMLSREKWLQDTVEHTFLAFQATTIGCARCHDHMYDPILQKEYYQVRAIFAPHQVRIDRVPGQADTKKDGLSRVYDADLNAATFLLIRGDDRTPDTTPLPPGVPPALGGTFAPSPVKLPPAAVVPDKRDFVTRETIGAAADSVTAAKQALSTALARNNAAAIAQADINLTVALAQQAALLAVLKVEALEESGRKETDEWKTAATEAAQAQRIETRALVRQKIYQAEQAKSAANDPAMTEAAEKKLREAQNELATIHEQWKTPATTAYKPRSITTYPAESSGRRLALARWLTDMKNPLTARVAVNHIWLRHFGQAIVPSVFDFGRNGRPPSMPALLDWLAAEFMNPSGGAAPWSMKSLHRLIVTSAVYRQASTPDAANRAMDRDNLFLWRMPPRRLEAELVRDNVLHVAGRLDPAMAGPDIDHTAGLKVFRRSLYFRHAAEKQMEFLKLFDAAGVTECYQRKESIIPQQALALANSELAVRMARLLARDLAQAHCDPAEFVTALFERTLTRRPTSAEMTECLAFLHEQQQASPEASGELDADGRRPAPDPALRAREGLAAVLLNHHEFVTIR